MIRTQVNQRDDLIECVQTTWRLHRKEEVLRVFYEPSSIMNNAYLVVETPSGKYPKTFKAGAVVKDVIDWIMSEEPKIKT